MVPLRRLKTSSRRSAATLTRSIRSSTISSSAGATATPSSWVRIPSTCAARRSISSLVVLAPAPDSSASSASRERASGGCWLTMALT
ncbi:MAG: hypothetical protein CVV20_03365 [Gemmatimonadetes bacterium HGW-Gemmatimonadetes-1]|nr:MAG: hypothetical protein CVV20_03365 [Gemmatimonadetes bacterium HGW-Gemmatimonadetes-1]